MRSLFDGTMASMTWKEIARRAGGGALALIPLGVIEEHGPHLCAGTDILAALAYCRATSAELGRSGMDAAIAPPFYWGVCQSTAGFPGSFAIRMETARNLLVDVIASLRGFGFSRIFGVNAHGDIHQHVMILDAFKEASAEPGACCAYVFPREIMHHYGVTGDEAHVCPLEPSSIRASEARAPDVHAGDIETALIARHYPGLADTELALTLPPVTLPGERAMEWLLGGRASELSPEGYLGDPADYAAVRIDDYVADHASRIVSAIKSKLGEA
jgi:creatinine amidohydrolase